MLTTDTIAKPINIGFIGASRAGTCIASYLKDSGLNVTGFYSRSLSSATDSTHITKTTLYLNIEALLKDSNLIIISVKDDYISAIWQHISQFNLKDKIICHLSGVLSSDVFTNSHNYACHVASMHIPIAFASKQNVPKALKNSYFILEGDLVTITKIQAILAITSNKFIFLSKENKIIYHAACVMASSLTLSLLDIAANLINPCFTQDSLQKAQDIVLNLAKSTLDNAINSGNINNSITGPVIRNESNTLKQHLNMIKEAKTKNLYRDLSIHLLDMLDIDKREKQSLIKALA